MARKRASASSQPAAGGDQADHALAARVRRAATGGVESPATAGAIAPAEALRADVVEIDAFLAAQAEFNRDTATALALLTRRLRELDRRLAALESTGKSDESHEPRRHANGANGHGRNGKRGTS